MLLYGGGYTHGSKREVNAFFPQSRGVARCLANNFRFDVILCDTGTQLLGLNDLHLPKASRLFTQIQWQCLGYGNGAVLGAALALTETSPEDRTILFAGDGGLQLVSNRIRLDVVR